MARAKRTDNKGRVLKVGEYQDKSGRYFYKWTQDGKRETICSLNLQELREQEKEIQRNIDSGISTSKRNMDVNTMFDLYMSTRNDLKPTTRMNYISIYDYNIREDFGKRKLRDIEAVHIRKLYTTLQNNGLSASTVKLIHCILSPVFQLAVESHVIMTNPTVNTLSVLKKDSKERTALTQGQQGILLDFVQGSVFSQWYPMILFDLCTGLRFGELSGLRWSNIDDEGAHIEEQLIYKNLDGNGCKFHLTSLKTDAGRRTIPLTKAARKALIRQKEIDLMLGKNGKRQEVAGAEDFCFVNKNGMPYSSAAFNFALKNIVQAYNKQETRRAELQKREPVLLPHVSAHILRHTACTRLAESGLAPEVTKEIMGHSSIEITLDVYTHLSSDFIQESVKAVDTENKIKVG